MVLIYLTRQVEKYKLIKPTYKIPSMHCILYKHIMDDTQTRNKNVSILKRRRFLWMIFQQKMVDFAA